MTTGKTLALTIWTFVGRVMSLLFNTLSRFVITFLARKFLILKDYFWFHGAVTVHSDFGAQEEEICHYFHLFSFHLPWSNGARCHDLIYFFQYLVLSWLFHSPPLSSSRGSLVPLCFLPLEWYHPHIWCFWCCSCLS